MNAKKIASFESTMFIFHKCFKVTALVCACMVIGSYTLVFYLSDYRAGHPVSSGVRVF